MPSSPLIPIFPGYGFYDFEAETPIIDGRKKTPPKSDVVQDFPSLSQFYTSSLALDKRGKRKSSTYLDRLNEAKVIGQASWSKGEGNKYEIVDGIAVGGMGAILRARDLDAQRDVAMKVMLGTKSDSPAAERFTREALIVAKLEHPNIIPVHDIGTSPEGEPYFTMTWIQGENLADILYKLRQGNLYYRNKYNLHTLLEIFVKICNGVAFAHSKNIVHLDLKPHNILVGDYGEVFVLDWGLAVEVNWNRLANNTFSPDDRATIPVANGDDYGLLTEDGTIKGTPGFMSPEQASGEVLEVDERSDVFSLGSILYMMLTLKFPIVGEHPTELLSNTINGNFVAPGKRVYHKVVSKQLEAVVMKAMALKKGDRFESVKRFQADIIAYLRGYPTSVEKAGFFKQLSSFLKRRKTEVGLICGSAVVILGLLGVIYLFMLRLDFQIQETHQLRENIDEKSKQMESAIADADSSRADAEAEKAAAQKARALADRNSYIANIRLSDISIDNSRYAIATDALKECPIALRHWEWGRLKYLTQLDSLTIPHPKSLTAACIGTSGLNVALADTDYRLTVHNVITGEAKRIVRNKDSSVISMTMMSDTSKLIVGGDDQTVELWDLETEQLIRSYTGHAAPVSALDLSGDGSVIAAASWDGDILIWNVETGKQIQSIEAHDGTVGTIALSHNGRQIVSGGDDAIVKLWDTQSGRQIGALERHPGPITSLDLNERYKLIVTGSTDQTIRIWNLEDGGQRSILAKDFGEIKFVSFSDDCQLVLAGGAKFLAGIWESQSGSLKRLFKGHAGPIITGAFIDGGEKIVTVSEDQTAKIWLVDGKDELRFLDRHDGEVLALAMSPDSQFVATGGADNTINIWSVESGEIVQTIEDYPGSLNGLCFSHNSEELISTSNEYAVIVWKLKTGLQRLKLIGHEDHITAIAASVDNRKIITGSYDRSARIWNAINGLQLLELKGHDSQIETVAISSTGDVAATAGEDRTVRLWNTETGNLIHLLTEFDDTVTALAISADASLLIVGMASGNVDIVSSRKGERIRSLKGHWQAVNAVGISTDNKRLFTGSSDTTVKVWNLKTGTELATLKAHDGAIHAIALSSDNRRLITAGADSKAIIWETVDWQLSDQSSEIKVVAEHSEIY